jgi:hypothetical protein
MSLPPTHKTAAPPPVRAATVATSPKRVKRGAGAREKLLINQSRTWLMAINHNKKQMPVVACLILRFGPPKERICDRK